MAKKKTENSISTLETLTQPSLDDLIKGGLGDSLTEDGVRKLLMKIERENVLAKYTFPTKPDKQGYYRVYISDLSSPTGRKQIRDKNLDNLKERVYRIEKNLPEMKNGISFQYAFEFAQEFERNNVSKERQQSRNNTISKNASNFRRFFEGTEFAELSIEKIQMRDIDAMIRTTMKKFSLTKKGMEALRGIINMTFKRAAYMEWIDDNPAGRIIWKDYKKLQCNSTPISERAYSDEEVQRIREYLSERQMRQPKYIPAFALEFQMLTGMRRGEIPPLLWDDVDFSLGTIHIHREQISQQRKQTDSEFLCDYTKNGKDRFYPIADLEEEFLLRLKTVHDTYYPNSPFLFPAKTKNGCISNNMVYQFFHRMCNKLGIPVSKDCIRGTHAFRRNAITNVVNSSNGNFVLTAEMFGNSPETIRKHYYTGGELESMRNILNKRGASKSASNL